MKPKWDHGYKAHILEPGKSLPDASFSPKIAQPFQASVNQQS